MSEDIKKKISDYHSNRRKCKHKRFEDFCCECNYGKISETEPPITDAYTEIIKKNGYKLIKGFNMLRGKQD
jgi:hypothetical protein